MKQIFTYILAAICIFAVAACEKGTESEGKKPSGSSLLQGVTIEAEVGTTSATTALLSYNVDFGPASSAHIDVMLRYSVSEHFPESATHTVKLTAGNDVYQLSGLQFDRQYHYELYLSMYGVEYNAKKGTFKTKPVSVALNDPSESLEGLILSGKVVGVSPEEASEFNVLLNVRDAASGDVIEYDVELAEDLSFSKLVSDLDIGAVYTFWTKVSQGTQKSVPSEEKTYTTEDPYVDAEIEFSGAATDLSENGTANCYVVASSGIYRFPLVKGNSNVPVGAVESVRVLWESFGTDVKPAALDLICATFKDGDYAVFEVPQAFKEGNAVIAAYDAQDNILWSWHIWLTAAEMKEITYANGAGVMMDRNLGALSATPNDPKALGLFYQWGRKDPFLGSSSISQPLYARSTRNLKVITNTPETATLSFATANPHKFILANQGGDWLSVKDNSLWGSTKTIYDPCPAGWRVPDGGYNGGLGDLAHPDGVWAKAGFSRQGETPFASGDYNKVGKNFSQPYCTPDTWYPAAGSIEYNSGQIYDLGVDGVYHSVTAFGGDDTMVTGLLFNYFQPLGVHYIYCGGEKFARAGGNSVRCFKVE